MHGQHATVGRPSGRLDAFVGLKADLQASFQVGDVSFPGVAQHHDRQPETRAA